MPEPTPTVFVVDDDSQSRKSLDRLLRSVRLNVKTFASAESFLERFDRAVPACLVLDVRMPGMSGLELQRRLNSDGISLPIVFVTAYADVAVAVAAMKAGARDFIVKPYSPQILLQEVQHALADDIRIRQRRAEFRDARLRLASLSPRERSVLELMVQGKTTKEVSVELNIAATTVDFHRHNLLEKMQVDNVVRLTGLVTQLCQAASDAHATERDTPLKELCQSTYESPR